MLSFQLSPLDLMKPAMVTKITTKMFRQVKMLLNLKITSHESRVVLQLLFFGFSHHFHGHTPLVYDNRLVDNDGKLERKEEKKKIKLVKGLKWLVARPPGPK